MGRVEMMMLREVRYIPPGNVKVMLVETSTKGQVIDKTPDFWVLRTRIFAGVGTQTLFSSELVFPFVLRFRSAKSHGTSTPVLPGIGRHTAHVVTQLNPREPSWVIPIMPSEVTVDLGTKVPVTVSTAAKGMLAQAPWPALNTLLGALRVWMSAKSQVKAARVEVLSDPEDISWIELVINLRLDVESDEVALGLWDEMGHKIDAAKAALDPGDKEWFNQHFAIHLIWGNDLLCY